MELVETGKVILRLYMNVLYIGLKGPNKLGTLKLALKTI